MDFLKMAKESAEFSNFAQRVKMKVWDHCISLPEDDLDFILLEAWKEINS